MRFVTVHLFHFAFSVLKLQYTKSYDFYRYSILQLTFPFAKDSDIIYYFYNSRSKSTPEQQNNVK